MLRLGVLSRMLDFGGLARLASLTGTRACLSTPFTFSIALLATVKHTQKFDYFELGNRS